MEDLTKLTAIELQVKGNQIKEKHDNLKQEIIDITYVIEELEKTMNGKAEEMQKLEEQYVIIVEIITSRESLKTTEENGI